MELRDIVRAQATMATLLMYDSLWTSYAQDSSLTSDEPFAVFETGTALQRELRNAVRAGKKIAQFAKAERFASLGDSLGQALSADEDGQVALAVLEEHDYSVAVLAQRGAHAMDKAYGEEAYLIERDARSIVAGGVAEGRLHDPFLCGLARASIAAGLISVWIPPHAHGGAAVALGVSVYKAAQCGGHPPREGQAT